MAKSRRQNPYSPSSEESDSLDREELAGKNDTAPILVRCTGALFALTRGVLASVAATAIGLATVLMVGMIWWPAGRGPQGVLLGAAAAAVAAQLIRHRSSWPACSIAASIGAVVASYLAIATAEVIEPGSLRWAVMGGMYGCSIGLPVSAILAPLGLIERRGQGFAKRELGE